MCDGYKFSSRQLSIIEVLFVVLVINYLHARIGIQVKCNFPQCKTMVTNDEYCQTLQYDVRNYFTRDSPNSAYLHAIHCACRI